MFGNEIRMGGFKALTKFHYQEGIAMGVLFAKTQGGHGSESRTGEIMKEIVGYGTAARSAIPELKELITERETPNGRILSVSTPVVISNPACLRCHSTPEAAPATMVDLYGANNGFGWKLNEVIGAQIVSVPMRVPQVQAWKLFTQVMLGSIAIFATMMVLLNLLLHFVIIKPVRGIATLATEVSMGNMDAPEVVVRGRDEISRLAESFNRMRRSLANALKMLGE